MTDTITAEQVVAAYLETWNDTDEQSRARRIETNWATTASYVDPLAEAHGTAEIQALIGGVQTQFPGWRFQLAGPVDAHHDLVRFTWALGPADVTATDAPVLGFDVLQVREGVVQSVAGFLDRVPAT